VSVSCVYQGCPNRFPKLCGRAHICKLYI